MISTVLPSILFLDLHRPVVRDIHILMVKTRKRHTRKVDRKIWVKKACFENQVHVLSVEPDKNWDADSAVNLEYIK